MVKLYKAAILAKKNFELRKSKKLLFQKYSKNQKDTNFTNHNQSYDTIKLNHNNEFIESLNFKNNRFISNHSRYIENHYALNSPRNSIMKMNNLQIIEYESNNNSNCRLTSPKIYKIIESKKDFGESLENEENDKKEDIHIDCAIKEGINDKNEEIEFNENKKNKIHIFHRKQSILIDDQSNLNIIIFKYINFNKFLYILAIIYF